MKTHLAVAMILSAISAVPSPAQIARTPDFSVGLGTWRLDGGTVANTATRIMPITVSTGWRVNAWSAIVVQVDYAWEHGLTPGLLLPGVGMRFETARRRPASLFATLTYNRGHFDASEREEVVENCRIEEGCLFEGVGYRSGSIGLFAGQVGFRFLDNSPLSLELLTRVNRKSSGPGGRSADSRYSGGFGLALAWRP